MDRYGIVFKKSSTWKYDSDKSYQYQCFLSAGNAKRGNSEIQTVWEIK